MTDSKKVAIIRKLNEARAGLLAFFTQLEPEAWETAVYHEESNWTITDILRHLVDAERGMTGLISQWQQGKNPVPPDFDLERWNNRVIQKAADKSSTELLIEFNENRSKLFTLIKTIQPEDWAKQGRHGSLRIMSIEEVCHLIADHERDHLRAMAQAKEVKN
jgi:hypothetical protein